MSRRRRREREFFSFDSFLDVVANVVGIIIKLILVAWVGARSYRAVVPPIPLPPPPVLGEAEPLPEPTDPRLPELAQRREEIGHIRQAIEDQQRQAGEASAARPAVGAMLTELEVRQKELDGERDRAVG